MASTYVALTADLTGNTRHLKSKHLDSQVCVCRHIFLFGAPGGHFRDRYLRPLFGSCRCSQTGPAQEEIRSCSWGTNLRRPL